MLSSSPGVRVLFLAAGAGGIRLFQPILSGEQQAQLVPWQCLRRLDLDSLVAGGFGWFEIAVRIRQQASRPLGIQQWQGGGTQPMAYQVPALAGAYFDRARSLRLR